MDVWSMQPRSFPTRWVIYATAMGRRRPAAGRREAKVFTPFLSGLRARANPSRHGLPPAIHAAAALVLTPLASAACAANPARAHNSRPASSDLLRFRLLSRFVRLALALAELASFSAAWRCLLPSSSCRRRLVGCGARGDARSTSRTGGGVRRTALCGLIPHGRARAAGKARIVATTRFSMRTLQLWRACQEPRHSAGIMPLCGKEFYAGDPEALHLRRCLPPAPSRSCPRVLKPRLPDPRAEWPRSAAMDT